MRYPDRESIQGLLRNQIPESVSLEYKSEVLLDSRDQKRELLKDLSGMGNGGGGTLIFGIGEESGSSVAQTINPLQDRAQLGRIEDIVRSGIHPPLIWSYEIIECEGGGFVATIDVEPSVTGPYRVDAYDEGRYYTRSMRSTFPMSESQVRDAYSLAMRVHDHRDEAWRKHLLPMRPDSEHPWLIISALPYEPLRDLFVGPEIVLNDFLNPSPLTSYSFPIGLRKAVMQMHHWADGLAGEGHLDDGLATAVRLHRDGGAGIAARQGDVLRLGELARSLNAYLLYLSWYWDKFQLTRPIEIEAAFTGLDQISFPTNMPHTVGPSVVQPAGVQVTQISVSEDLYPAAISRAAIRHALIQRFIHRLTIAYGRPFSNELFEYGWLFGRRGERSRYAISRGMIWDPNQGAGIRVALIDESGRVVEAQNEHELYAVNGVLFDGSGDTVGVTEMAVGVGCPDPFLPSERDLEVSSPGHQGIEPIPATAPSVAPQPTGNWSQSSIAQFFQPSIRSDSEN
jgi:hypothetical protein